MSRSPDLGKFSDRHVQNDVSRIKRIKVGAGIYLESSGPSKKIDHDDVERCKERKVEALQAK